MTKLTSVRDKKERHAGKIALILNVRAILSGISYQTTLDSGPCLTGRQVFFFNLEKVYEEKFRNDHKGDDYEVFRKPYPELTFALPVIQDVTRH